MYVYTKRLVELVDILPTLAEAAEHTIDLQTDEQVCNNTGYY